ncbi:MAG TPA: hypothetical protein EYH05_15400, partial [Anaerolineae bacterium]|nr:hypothetical protein [Anaerolineae bacterium]
LEMAGNSVNTTSTYDPFGNLLAQTGTGGTVYGYAGEQFDDSAGLLYLRARYYNPSLKVFISQDPWAGYLKQPQTLNGYTYVINNSVNFTDPSGLICIFGFGNCDEEDDLFTLPWKLFPNDLCLPGDLGCWGGSNYADWLEDDYYPTLPLQYAYNNFLSNPPDFRVTDTSPFCDESWLTRRDLTSWLVNQMNVNASGETAQTIRNLRQNGPDGFVTANATWYMMVRSNAPWDFKPDIQKEIGNQVILANTWYSFDVPANIHYGYVGRAIGFDRDWLLFGAGAAQIKAGTSDRNWGAWYFDDPSDYTAVQVGMDLFDRYRYNITESNLATVLEERKSLLKLAPAQIPPGATP